MELCGASSALSWRSSISPPLHSSHRPTSVCQFRRLRVWCVVNQGNQMTVSITGATGFIGSRLVQRLYEDNHSIRVLTRSKSKAESIFPVKDFPGIVIAEEPQWKDCIQGSTGVVNLAGLPISTRWSPEIKKEIKQSRIRVTSKNHLKHNCSSLPDGFLQLLRNLMSQEELQNEYGKPMVWIGIYIAIASLFCILPMLADIIHGFINKKLWFPCKYFTLNAASLTVIAVAMKLPMDLNSSMPGDVDQAAKFGSMAFMCTMMTNLLPSLATMESKELLTNMIALRILVITLVVNVCIQMKTGVTYIWLLSILYVTMLLTLLMMHTCSALMIIKSKQILESKYKEGHQTTLKNLELKQPTIEKLKQHVSNHWTRPYPYGMQQQWAIM